MQRSLQIFEGNPVTRYADQCRLGWPAQPRRATSATPVAAGTISRPIAETIHRGDATTSHRRDRQDRQLCPLYDDYRSNGGHNWRSPRDPGHSGRFDPSAHSGPSLRRPQTPGGRALGDFRAVIAHESHPALPKHPCAGRRATCPVIRTRGSARSAVDGTGCGGTLSHTRCGGHHQLSVTPVTAAASGTSVAAA
jgi:hypothetical protein